MTRTGPNLLVSAPAESGLNPMMNVAERKQTNAPADAQQWLANFEAALQAKDIDAVANLFHADGLWRDVLAFTWTIETMSGRAAIAATLRETLARTAPRDFHIPAKRTPPRWVTRAGTEAIEAGGVPLSATREGSETA